MDSLILLLGTLPMTSFGSQTAPSECSAGAVRALTDFTPTTDDLAWYVLNDNVMGGRSEGGFAQARGELRFKGRTNTNGGGFSSIRTGPLQIDLSAYTGIRLRILGDGRRYMWRLTSTADWRGQRIGYWATFATQPSKWTTVDIPWARFVPRFRGKALDGPPLDVARITGMGLMIYDGQDGPFEVRLDRVGAYTSRAATTLAQYRWKHRVLVLSALAVTDADLVRVRRDVAATAEAFSERDMVLVTLLDDSPSTAGDVSLTTQEVDCLRSEARIRPGSFGLRLIGKDGGIKRSSDSAISIDELYRQIDAMPMRQSEARRRPRSTDKRSAD